MKQLKTRLQNDILRASKILTIKDAYLSQFGVNDKFLNVTLCRICDFVLANVLMIAV